MSKKKENTRLKNIGFVLSFILGLSILLYPTISNKWNEYRASRLISQCSDVITQEKDPKEYDEQMEKAKAYNRQVKSESIPDAFSVRDGVQDDEYDAMLNMDGNGMMGSVEIPSIDVNIPIYHYTTTESLEKGAGHLFGSSLPVGGDSTHCIISAHRGLPQSKLFTDLNLVEEGDVFYFHILGDTLAYEVDQIQTVLPEEVESLGIKDGEDLATLITCTPYAVNTHRILVRGHRIPFVKEEYVEEQHKAVKKDTNRMLMQGLCVIVGLVIALIIVGILTRKDRKTAKAVESAEEAAVSRLRSDRNRRNKDGKK